MPKQLPFPKFKLQDCLEFCALIAHYPNISVTDAASLQKKQISGHFMNLISSCVKFGLLKHQKGQLDIKPLANSCLSKNKVMNLGNFSDSQLLACLQALETPTGFAFLHKHWLNTQTLDINLIASHLNLSLQHSKHAKDVLIDSMIWLKSQKTSKNLNNKTNNIEPPTNKESHHSFLSSNTKMPFTVTLTGPNLNIELCLDSAKNIELLRQILNHISTQIST